MSATSEEQTAVEKQGKRKLNDSITILSYQLSLIYGSLKGKGPDTIAPLRQINWDFVGNDPIWLKSQLLNSYNVCLGDVPDEKPAVPPQERIFYDKVIFCE